MKTNEEKLKKLLEVAKTNGWNKITYEIQSIQIKDYFVQLGTWSGDYHWFSLNDLVTNFEPNEVSFIEALCETISNNPNFYYNFINCIKDTNGATSSDLEWYDVVNSVRMKWTLQPTSQRLEWLFSTFNHLLI